MTRPIFYLKDNHLYIEQAKELDDNLLSNILNTGVQTTGFVHKDRSTSSFYLYGNINGMEAKISKAIKEGNVGHSEKPRAYKGYTFYYSKEKELSKVLQETKRL